MIFWIMEKGLKYSTMSLFFNETRTISDIYGRSHTCQLSLQQFREAISDTRAFLYVWMSGFIPGFILQDIPSASIDLYQAVAVLGHHLIDSQSRIAQIELIRCSNLVARLYLG